MVLRLLSTTIQSQFSRPRQQFNLTENARFDEMEFCDAACSVTLPLARAIARGEAVPQTRTTSP
jgi:hypothetical protein